MFLTVQPPATAQRRPSARAWRLALCAGLALWVSACGPERTLSGAWRQVCDEANGERCDSRFVYMLHVGRYGDAVTGIAVRYVRASEDSSLSDTDDSNECGCFVMASGRATDTRLSFSLDLAGDTPSGGPGCRERKSRFETETCVPELANPSAETLAFKLTGDEDALTGTISAGDRVLVDGARFEPATDKTRTMCHATCDHLPDAGQP